MVILWIARREGTLALCKGRGRNPDKIKVCSMDHEKYIIQLADRIPVRNINFYIDSCRAMSAVQLQELSSSEEAERELRRLKDLIVGRGLKARPQAAAQAMIDYVTSFSSIDTRTGMKLIGKLMILYLRQGEFNEGTGHLSTLPFNFISYAVVEDLKLHGQGPSYSLVERFLDDLAERQIIESDFHARAVRNRCVKYTDTDIAVIFLGYSLAGIGGLLPLVPFPSKPTGFVTVLIAELKKLLPLGEANRFIKSLSPDRLTPS